ncbi:35400_t:CDS:2 [Racocetra persica]|uniref:35400_t:CDS:1 n=1 Tax=Racocetra persica TaxID=160502 RepID=A0ACA9LRC6_9GLOM|nr:35400_t:CDS:2 [Racocetra persica]
MSISDNSQVIIPIEEVQENSYENKQFSKIVCSPHLKYVAALYKDNYISIWSVVGQEKYLKHEKTLRIDNICTKGEDERIFAISDDKYVSIGLNKVDPKVNKVDPNDPYNFKIFDFETKKKLSLTFPDWQKEIDFLSFIDNGDIIMVNTKHYRAYVFSNKDDIAWVCKSMIELKYFNKLYITPKGKLILFNDPIYEITMWNIEKLSIETCVLIDWDCTLKSIEISEEEELLLVCAKNEENEETRLYVFDIVSGRNISSFITKSEINKFHLIASKKGERLLYISGNQYFLMDPYYLDQYIDPYLYYFDQYTDPYLLMQNLIDTTDDSYLLMLKNNNPIDESDYYNLQSKKSKNPIDASKLFKRIQIQNQEPYIIRSDKIIYTIDGRVLIEELVPNNWVKYLRKDLKDTNSITTTYTIDIITEMINKILNNNILNGDYNADKKEFTGEFLKWGLELGDNLVRLTVVDFNYDSEKWNDDKKKHLDILPSFLDE